MTPRGPSAFPAALRRGLRIASVLAASASPALGQSGTPAVVPQVAVAAQGEDVRNWGFSLSIDQSWDSNALFQAAGASDQIGRVGASLGRYWRRPRTEFSLTANGAGRMYQRLSDLNTIDYGAGAALSHRFSTRTTANLSGGVNSTYSGFQPVLADQALLLPLTRSLVTQSGLGLNRRLTARTDVSVGVSHQRIQFESDALIDGWALSAGTGLRRRMGSGGNASIAYGFSRNRAAGTESLGMMGDSHSATGTLDGTLLRNVFGQLSLGVSRFRPQGAQAAQLTPTGSVSLGTRLRRYVIAASFFRGVDQAFGFGRQRVSNLVNASISGSPFGGLGVTVSWTQGFSSDPGTPDPNAPPPDPQTAAPPAPSPAFDLDSGTATVDLGYSLWRRVQVNAGYSYRRSDVGGTTRRAAQVLRIALSYSVAWGRPGGRRLPGEPAPEPPAAPAAPEDKGAGNR